MRRSLSVILLGLLCLGAGSPYAGAEQAPKSDVDLPRGEHVHLRTDAADGADDAHLARGAAELADNARLALRDGASERAAAGVPARIAYKQDNDSFGPLLLRAAGGVVLMALLALAIALLAKRYMPSLRGYSVDGKSRIQLLETRRITPKLTLYLIEVDGRQVLLAQSGDRLLELGANAGGGHPAQDGQTHG